MFGLDPCCLDVTGGRVAGAAGGGLRVFAAAGPIALLPGRGADFSAGCSWLPNQ